MQITKTLTAAALAITVMASGAQAGQQTITTPNNNSGILIGAVVLGLLGLLIYTGDNDDETMSTKNAPDLGVDLPPQGGNVIADF